MKNKLEPNSDKEFYFDLVENATDLIQVVSGTGDIIYVNKSWCKQLGYTKQEAAKLNFSDIVLESELPHCREIFQKILKGEKVRNIETVFVSKKGKQVMVSGNVSLRIVEGEPISTRGIFRNVTKQHESKLRLEEIKNQFKAIFNSSNLGVTISTPEGMILEANKAFHKMMGYSKKELKGINFIDITHPDYRKENKARHKKFVAGKTDSYSIEKRFIKKDGSAIWAGVTATKVLDGNGKMISSIGVIENIDKRKKLEESESKVNQLREMILDNASLTVISLDKNGAIQAFNKTAEKLLGYKAEEMIGLSNPPFHDIKEIKERTQRLNAELGTNFKPGLETFIGKIRLTKQPDEYELTYISKSGERIPVLLSASPIFDHNGEIDGYVGIGLDLRERKQAELELQQTRLFTEAIAEQSPNVIYILDYDTKTYIYSNGYLGHKEEDLRAAGKDVIKKITHPDDWEYSYSHYNEFDKLEKGAVLEFEQRLLDSDSEWRWMFFKETVFKRKPDGSPLQILGVAIDITDRKNAEEELKRYQEGLKAINSIASRSTGSFKELIDDSLEIACNYLNMQMGVVADIKGQRYIINHIYTSPAISKAEFNIKKEYDLKDTFSKDVIKKGDIVIINDVEEHPITKAADYNNVGARAYIGMPLWIGDKIAGTISFLTFWDKHIEFTGHQIEFTKVLSRWIGATIERQRAAEQLEQSKLFAEAIATQSPNAIYILDYDTKSYVYSNKIGLESLGRGSGEYKNFGENLIEEITHPDDREFAYKHFDDFMHIKDGEVIEFEQRVKDEMGNWVWYFIRETVFKRKPNGKPAQILGVAVDITERKITEEELEKLSIVADQTDSGVVISDAEGKTEWVNNAFVEITGYTLEELKGKRPSEVLVGPDTNRESIDYMFKKQDEHEAFAVEVLNYRKDGKPIWFSITNTPVMKDGKFAGKYIEIAIDITEKKETEFQLIKAKETAERSAKIKEEFLANMSHEIRTPMNSVIGFADILIETVLTGSQRKYVESIHTAGQNLKVILDDILSFSKMEAGKLTVVNKEFNLHSLIIDLTNLFSQKAEEKHIQLGFAINSSVPEYVIADDIRLGQVLNNLVSNAIKFTEQGKVDIAVEVIAKDKKQVQIEFRVSDTGIGIPKNKLSKVFESFTQAKTDTTRKYGGTGLGLTIAKRLVELMGGNISVKSKVGEGTVFTVNLPIQVSTKVKAHSKNLETMVRKKLPDLTGYKILLCEDNMLNQRLASEILVRLANAELDIANDGKVGLEKLKNGNYDIVLMDLHMPEMDGIDTAKKIRQLKDEKKDVPIIAMTADAMEKERKRCFAVGMNDYISKPFKKEELLEKIIHHATPSGSAEKKEGKLYDLSNLYDVASGDEEFVKEMAKTFIRNMPVDLDILEGFLKKNKLEDAAKQGHKLKSSLGLIGLKSGHELATNIEDGIGQGRDYMKALTSELRGICERVAKDLKKDLSI